MQSNNKTFSTFASTLKAVGKKIAFFISTLGDILQIICGILPRPLMSFPTIIGAFLLVVFRIMFPWGTYGEEILPPSIAMIVMALLFIPRIFLFKRLYREARENVEYFVDLVSFYKEAKFPQNITPRFEAAVDTTERSIWWLRNYLIRSNQTAAHTYSNYRWVWAHPIATMSIRALCSGIVYGEAAAIVLPAWASVWVGVLAFFFTLGWEILSLAAEATEWKANQRREDDVVEYDDVDESDDAAEDDISSEDTAPSDDTKS